VEDLSRKLAALTPGFAGAEIANICNEAAIQAARADKEQVDLLCFEKATDRVIGGLETGKIISQEEQRKVAYHEAGHAVAGWFLENADPILKVTIVPRGNGALGFAQFLPKEVALHTTDQLQDKICMALGGRVAEELTFGEVTTGASDDLKRVTQMAYQMTQVWGMNPRIGQLSFPKEEGGFPDRMYSESTAEAIDEEAKKLVDDMYSRTKDLLIEKKDAVAALAERLIEVETINHDDIVSLIGARPFEGSEEYKSYVASQADYTESAAEAEVIDESEDTTAEEPPMQPTFACKKL